MNSGDISFPNLGLYLKDVPTAFSIFGIRIAWYGIFIGIGAVVGFAIALWQAKKEKIDTELLWDFIIYAILFSIIGARIYYVIFEWDMYKDNPIEIFNIREGGLAIYGGVIAGFLTCYIFTKIKKISFLRFADVCVTGLITGQIFGRWGNFTNREVFGGYSDGLLCMRIPYSDVRNRDVSAELYAHMITDGTDYIQVHPTFLYESALNLCTLLFMLLYRKHKKFQGEMVLIYLGGYGIVRFFIEGIRTDRLTFGHTNIAVSQVLSLLLFVFSVFADLIVRVMIRRKEALAQLNGSVQTSEENPNEEQTSEENSDEEQISEDASDEEQREEETSEELSDKQ